MADILQKIHGTTTDRFQVGGKSQQIVLTGKNTDADTVALKNRENTPITTNSTTFFTAYLLGQATDLAAFEIKGCYVKDQAGLTGLVVNTFLNTNEIPVPEITFSSTGTLTINCTGLAGQNIQWSGIVDFIKI
jgi:hypothetical protein